MGHEIESSISAQGTERERRDAGQEGRSKRDTTLALPVHCQHFQSQEKDEQSPEMALVTDMRGE